ncbi:MAG: redoxin domain-containing protein, partial [Gemmatimonadota bacterium]|nr:redoxin domain-containing protein [Gemmatimonadota bacterium]
QYAELFNEGRNVVLMAISNDSPEEGASWLKDEDFPYLFGSDPGGGAFAAFGGSLRDNGMVGSRAVIVIGPDGRVAKVIPQFRQTDPTAYDELAAVIDEVTPEPDEGS